MSAQSEASVGPAAETSITLRRNLDVKCAAGIQHWTLNEFDNGRSFMLVCNTAALQFHAHFDAEDWAAFQELVALEREENDPLIDGRRVSAEEAVEPCVNNEGYEVPGDRP